MKKNLEQIAREDTRFSLPAIRFVYEGLGYTAKKVTDKPKHVSGQTLCEGLRKLAIEKWGRLAILVLNTWGVQNHSRFRRNRLSYDKTQMDERSAHRFNRRFQRCLRF